MNVCVDSDIAAKDRVCWRDGKVCDRCETCDRCGRMTGRVAVTRMISGRVFDGESVPMVSRNRSLVCCVECADGLDDTIWQAAP